MVAQRDYYQDLGVPPSASADEITSAYRALVRTLHPDARRGRAPAQDRFAEVVTAYRTLHDPRRRARYDTERAGVPGAATTRRGTTVRVRLVVGVTLGAHPRASTGAPRPPLRAGPVRVRPSPGRALGPPQAGGLSRHLWWASGY